MTTDNKEGVGDGGGTENLLLVEEEKLQKEFVKTKTDESRGVKDQPMRLIDSSKVGVMAHALDQRPLAEHMIASDARNESHGMPSIQYIPPLMQPMYGAHVQHPPPQQMLYAQPHYMYTQAPPAPVAFSMYQQQQNLMYQQLQRAQQVQQWQQQQHAQWQHIEHVHQQHIMKLQESKKQKRQHLAVVDDKKNDDGAMRKHEKSRADVLTMPPVVPHEGAHLEVFDTGHLPKSLIKKRKSQEETEQAPTTKVSFEAIRRNPNEPTIEAQGTVPAPIEEQRGGGGGGVEPEFLSLTYIGLDGIEKLAATIELALKEWVQRKGPDYECSYGDLSYDVQQSIVAVHRDDATCMRAYKEKVDICLNVMIGCGLIRRVSADSVVVIHK